MTEGGPRDAVGQGTGSMGPVFFWIAAFMIVFAPLVRGGNRPIPLFVLEMSATVVLAASVLASRPARPRSIPLLAAAIAVLLASACLQLVPVPFSVWASLPGHGPYAQALEGAVGPQDRWHALTMHATATEYAALALLPALAMFVAVRRLERSAVRRLVLVFIAVALGEALLGIIQLGSPAGSPLYFGNPWAGGVPVGTYVNKNHFAALLAMALPPTMALWATEMVPEETPAARRCTCIHAIAMRGSRAGSFWPLLDSCS